MSTCYSSEFAKKRVKLRRALRAKGYPSDIINHLKFAELELMLMRAKKNFKMSCIGTRYIIETWYDKDAKSYTTHIFSYGKPDGDASYSGDKSGAESDHKRKVDEAIDDTISARQECLRGTLFSEKEKETFRSEIEQLQRLKATNAIY